jgi:hypothetical protein
VLFLVLYLLPFVFSCLCGLGVVALPRALVCREQVPSVKGLGLLSFFIPRNRAQRQSLARLARS